MWELDHKQGWTPKNWCFWTVMLEKTLESTLGCKEIKPINPKGNQPWIFIGRTDAEAPILWPPDGKSQLIGKDPDAEQDWGQMTEDEMVGWHHRLNGHEFKQAPGDSEGQGSLACCSPWGRKESDKTEWLKNKQQRERVTLQWRNLADITLTNDQGQHHQWWPINLMNQWWIALYQITNHYFSTKYLHSTNQLVLFKRVKIMKNKAKLRNYLDWRRLRGNN